MWEVVREYDTFKGTWVRTAIFRTSLEAEVAAKRLSQVTGNNYWARYLEDATIDLASAFNGKPLD